MAELAASPRPKRARRALYWAAALALAGLLLYFSLRGVDWRRVAAVLQGAKPALVGAALGAILTALALRSLRWRVLLSAEAEVSRSDVFWATAAGYLGNNVLPARAGELVRTVMIARHTGLTKTYVLTTALSERLVDAIALVAISAAALLVLPTQPGWLAEAARPLGIGALAGITALALAPLFESFWQRALTRAPLPAALRRLAEHALKHGLQGLRSFHDRRRLIVFLAYTAAIWMLDGVITVVGARAIGVEISLPLAFLLIAGLGLGSALPSTPGYVGIYQFVAVSVLTPFGIDRSDAVAYILLFQALNCAVFAVCGSLGLWKSSALELMRHPGSGDSGD